MNESGFGLVRNAVKILNDRLNAESEIHRERLSRAEKFDHLSQQKQLRTLSLPDQSGVMRNYRNIVRLGNSYLTRSINLEELHPDYYIVSNTLSERQLDDLGILTLSDVIKEEFATDSELTLDEELSAVISSDWFAEALKCIYEHLHEVTIPHPMKEKLNKLKEFTIAFAAHASKVAVLKSSKREIAIKGSGIPCFIKFEPERF